MNPENLISSSIQIEIKDGSLIRFESTDKIEFTIRACDSVDVIGCSDCNCNSIKASIEIKEKNKAPLPGAENGYQDHEFNKCD